jgi:LCP family protein required for cell wall assembly
VRADDYPSPADPTTTNGSAGLTRVERLRLERSRRRGRVSTGVRIVSGLLAVAVLVGSGWAWASYRSFESNIVRIDAIPAPETSGPSKAPHQDVDGKDQNILIVGNDSRDGATAAELADLGTTADPGASNTDTMMLMHVPANGSRASVISFPRDSYVAIPGHGMGKLNSAYSYGVQDAGGDAAGGARLLIRTLSALTGLTIDHYVSVGLLGFYRISKAIGGVPVCLLHPQNAQTDSDQNGSGYSGINLKAGWQTIQGKQALAFVRQRHGVPGGDLGRINRQHYFLSQAFKKIASAGTFLSPTTITKLLDAVRSSIQMDPGLDPLSLLGEFGQMSAGNITFSNIPTDGSTINEVGWVFLVNPAEVQAKVAALIGKKPAPVPPASARSGAGRSPAAAAHPALATPTPPPATSSSDVTTAAQNTGGCID